uniref:SET domain-containing protein n=1 Tax=Panagrellus redivivus TaxID=6233 RepID=A0A7E5A209_PANRE
MSGPHLERNEAKEILKRRHGEILLQPPSQHRRMDSPPLPEPSYDPTESAVFEGDILSLADDNATREPNIAQPSGFNLQNTRQRPRIKPKSDKLHRYTDVTVMDMCAGLLAFSRKFAMTDEATAALLELIKIPLPDDHNMPKSMKAVEKVVDATVKDGIRPITYEYCERCPFNRCACDHPSAYFVKNDLEALLKRLVRQNFHEMREYPAYVASMKSGYADVQNGSAYKARMKEVPPGHMALPMNLFVDGGSFTNSTNTQTWPICLSLLNLRPIHRQAAKNVIILGFWHGPKPDWNFIAELINDYFNRSFNIDGFYYYLFIAVLTADMPGRAAFLNTMNPGALEACLFCDVKGVKDAGKGVRYGVVKNLRTEDDFVQNSIAADLLNSRGRKKMEHVGCNKGTSKVHTILKSPTEVAVDNMHTIDEGTPRDDLEKLVDGHKESLITKITPEQLEELAESFSTTQWPYEVDRKLRDLSEHKRWKASEWSLFITAMTPSIVVAVLKDSHPQQALSMLMFSAFVHLVSAQFIPEENITIAQIIIDHWRQIRTKTWGMYSLTLKSHEVLHIPHKITVNGPPRAYSGFSGENVVGVLGRLITSKSKKNAAIQMRDRYCIDHKLQVFQADYQLHPKLEKVMKSRNRRVKDTGFDSPLLTDDTYFHIIRLVIINAFHVAPKNSSNIPSVTPGGDAKKNAPKTVCAINPGLINNCGKKVQVPYGIIWNRNPHACSEGL